MGYATAHNDPWRFHGGRAPANLSNPLSPRKEINGYDPSSNYGTTIWRSDSGDLFQGEVDLDELGSYPGPETEFNDNNALNDIGPSPWTIATVVTEASPFTLLAFPVSVFLLGRRRFRGVGH